MENLAGSGVVDNRLTALQEPAARGSTLSRSSKIPVDKVPNTAETADQQLVKI